MSEADDVNLGIFNHLSPRVDGKHIGSTWENKDLLSSTQGGPGSPFSYNLMPLPQKGGDGYILKNFAYYEILRFNSNDAVAHQAQAPNRGGEIQQLANALFYDQNVLFAEGPAKTTPVHVENGSWLNLFTAHQSKGPYGTQGTVNEDADIPPQPSNIAIAKQISVPHGNSILALGSYSEGAGSPTIPDAPNPLPTPDGLNTARYDELLNGQDNYQNPNPGYTKNSNKPIQEALEIINPTHYIQWEVSTEKKEVEYADGKKEEVAGAVTNIPFEKRKADVTEYTAEYWLLSTDNGQNYNYLLYTQNIVITMMVSGKSYSFPHTTSNALTRTA